MINKGQTRAFISGILLILVINSCNSGNQKNIQKAEQKPMAVNGVVVEPTRIDNKIFSTGTILANEEVEIRSEVSGRITAINFDEGNWVKKGDLLVKINDDDLKAQLQKLQLQESLAKDDFYRKTKLLELTAISQEEFDISKNQLEVVQADIQLIKSQIAKTEIFAPFGGQIGLRYVSPGGYVSPAMQITNLQEVDPIKIEFTVPEKYISQISKSTTIFFTVEGRDSIFSGKVYAIDPRIDAATRTLTVRAKCPNPGNLISPGAFAKVEILLETITDALVVPSESIIPDIRGEKLCIPSQGKAKFVYITSGIRTARNVQVLTGLQPGDTVITTGLLQLREDMNVTIKLLPL